MKLPPRLATVVGLVNTGKPIADIGSDHALLPRYLVGEGYCPWAICGELGDGPYQRTRQAIDVNQLNQLIAVRQGYGLEVLDCGEVSTVVLTGLGGNTIIEILERSTAKTRSFERLILQPMNALAAVRRLACNRGWRIEQEMVVKDGTYYVNLVLDPRGEKAYRLTEPELRWGPVLMRINREPAVRDYYSFHRDKLLQIVKRIPPDSIGRSQMQKLNCEERIRELEEVLR